MNIKNTLIIVGNIMLTIVIVFASLYFKQHNVSNNNNSNDLQNIYSSKLSKLKLLSAKTKIQDIDLLSSIKKVKHYSNIYAPNIILRYAKNNARGANYLMNGSKTMMLWFINKIYKELDIDINNLEFAENDKLTVDITILGKEK